MRSYTVIRHSSNTEKTMVLVNLCLTLCEEKKKETLRSFIRDKKYEHSYSMETDRKKTITYTKLKCVVCVRCDTFETFYFNV